MFAKVTSASSEINDEDNMDFITISRPTGSVALPDDNTIVDEGGTEIENTPGDTASTDTGSAGTGNGGTGTPTQSNVAVSRISITGISHKIAAGKKIQLSAVVAPSRATMKTVTWKSSNTKYATVNSKGKVTTKKAGKGKTVTITAKAKDGSGVKATYKISIMKNSVKRISLKAKSKTVKAGKSVTVKPTVTTTGTKSVNKVLKWTSSKKLMLL